MSKKFRQHLLTGETSKNLVEGVSHPRPTMGVGDYAIPQDGKPLGWDYDTLLTAALAAGHGYQVQKLSDGELGDLIEKLEDVRATNNDEAKPILDKFVGGGMDLPEDGPVVPPNTDPEGLKDAIVSQLMYPYF